MRIWSIHPKYLDAKGFVALWRESLLAKNVLEGRTRGYKHHPQLIRFRDSGNPVDGINQYLSMVYEDSLKRGYHFDSSKFNRDIKLMSLPVTDKQLEFEMKHLLGKLEIRDPDRYLMLSKEANIVPHPLFHIVQGEVILVFNKFMACAPACIPFQFYVFCFWSSSPDAQRKTTFPG